jgi:large subunit ribosomal protein L13
MITIDAQDKTLGRVASAAAKALLGKHTASFAKNIVDQNGVTIVNASKIKISGNKLKDEDLHSLLWLPRRSERGDL